MVLDCIESLGSSSSDAVLNALAEVLQIQANDRDTFGDFDGFKSLCQAAIRLSDQSLVLCAFCNAAAHLCTKSQLNRGIFRAEGGIRIVVQFLSQAHESSEVVACARALRSVCLANDGNKKAAANLDGEFNDEELMETECLDTTVPFFKTPNERGAIDLLVDRLEEYDGDVDVQESCVWALREITCDNDTRQSSCAPSAVQNRDYLSNEINFPRIRQIVRSRIKDPDIRPGLLEGLLCLLKEVSCNQYRIRDLVLEDNLLPIIAETLEKGSDSLVRAALFCLRQYAFLDDVKDVLLDQHFHVKVLTALKGHTINKAIVEQAFGIFSNMTMRKPDIARTLHEYRIFAVSQVILDQHKGNPNVVKTVLSTLRNVATQCPECAQEIQEQGLFDYMRTVVIDMKNGTVVRRDESNDLIDHCGKLEAQTRGNQQWQAVFDICRQFLREFREDTGGIREATKYNEYY